MSESPITENPYQADPVSEVDQPSKPSKWFGIAAIVFGLIGMTCSILSYHFFEEKPARAQSSLKIDLGFVKWEKKSSTPPPPKGVRDMVDPFQVRMAGVSFGVAAVILSVISWCRREGFWLGLGGCVFAAAAVAWVWFICVFAFLLLSGGLFTLLPHQTRPHVPT